MPVHERMRDLFEESGINPKFIQEFTMTPAGVSITRLHRLPGELHRFELDEAGAVLATREYYVIGKDGLFERQTAKNMSSASVVYPGNGGD